VNRYAVQKWTGENQDPILKSELFSWYMMDQKGVIMAQLHKKFTADQIKGFLTAYEAGHISRSEIQNALGIGKTRFFALLKQLRNSPRNFSTDYQRKSKPRLSIAAEERIRHELMRDKALVDNQELPIYGYNYAALTDRLKQSGITVSTTTVIKRAIQQGCYIPRRKKKAIHDREVLTSGIGELIQHDASLHKWSPFATEKWTLITSLDDYSRMLLYADFIETETSWAHIHSAQSLMQNYGVPSRYYVDNLRVFRFIQYRDSLWRKQTLDTDDVNTQWRQVMALMKIDVTYAQSPQAKGKIERPYRWLQDRIVRTCALEGVASLEDARVVLRQEVHRYNFQQVHSTTQEVPYHRFEQAGQEHRSLFRPFTLPKPYTNAADIFCLRLQRTTDGYRKISIGGRLIQLSKVDPRTDVDLHLIPNERKDTVEIRCWVDGNLIQTVRLPISGLSKAVHF